VLLLLLPGRELCILVDSVAYAVGGLPLPDVYGQQDEVDAIVLDHSVMQQNVLVV
jgi:hypothetical protein